MREKMDGHTISSYYPALSWFILFCGFMLVVLHRFITAGLQDTFTHTFAMSATGFAFLSSSYFYLYPLMQVPAGFALDIFGPRRIAIASFLIMTAGTILFASASTFGGLFWGRVLISFGASFIWGTLLKIQGIFFPARLFALLTGFGAVAGSFGIILAGSPFMAGVANFGWRETIYIIALGSFTLMLGSLLFIRPPSNISGRDSLYSANRSLKAELRGAGRVLTRKAGILLFFCHFGIYGTYAAFLGIWSYPFLAAEAGLTVNKASFMITWMGIGYMFGGPVLGHLSDRFGQKRKPVLLITCGGLTLFMASLMLLPLFKANPVLLLYPALFWLGFFTPGLVLTMVLARELLDPSFSGVAVGVANSGGFVGAALVQLAVGFILDRGWQGDYINGIMSYPWPVMQQVIVFSTFLLAVSFLSAYMVKEHKSGFEA